MVQREDTGKVRVERDNMREKEGEGGERQKSGERKGALKTRDRKNKESRRVTVLKM